MSQWSSVIEEEWSATAQFAHSSEFAPCTAAAIPSACQLDASMQFITTRFAHSLLTKKPDQETL
jgi:hypothetical protein